MSIIVEQDKKKTNIITRLNRSHNKEVSRLCTDMCTAAAGTARSGQLRHPGVGLWPARCRAGPAEPGHGGGGLGRQRCANPARARLAATHIRPPWPRPRITHLLDSGLHPGI